ncbi:hybrid sensor histidine kinase/response regulator [Capnocytophaga canimorsus]|uniref:hybrid sensor histidine kinase/response regulator n=1 Tax=Capnocytophaga canimorsus TaxID=28188 RepID=UPI0037CDA051
MKTSNKKITIKVIVSYLFLGILSAIVALFIHQEIEKLAIQEEIYKDGQNNIFKISKILTSMYETESAGRIAVQSDNEDSFLLFTDKNNQLQQEIESFKADISSKEHHNLLDSVQNLLELKKQNIHELRILKNSDSSFVLIRSAILKLSSLEPSMGNFLLPTKTKSTNKKTVPTKKDRDTDIRSIIKKYKDVKLPPVRYQSQIDEAILQTRKLLSKMEEDVINHKTEHYEKTRLLWQNDLRISEKLKDLLHSFEKEIIHNTELLNIDRQKAFQRSRWILSIAFVIALLVMIVFSLVILNDFWKIQKYRVELERANLRSNNLLKSREQLISMVSHDLRTPLSTIVGYSELLRKNTSSEKDKNYIKHIQSASQFVTKLVDELLDYAKIEAGKITIEKVPVDLVEIVKEVAQNVRSTYPNKAIELILDFSESVKNTRFSSDAYRIKQVLYNIISNAYKFTEKGNIKVLVQAQTLEHSLHEISIAVTDTGIGIKKENQNAVFEEFNQENTSKNNGGYGLGLHICQKLAHLLKGKISLQSSEGVGSTFTFTFKAQKVTEKQKDKIWTSLKKAEEITIIIIDDDFSVLELIKEMLKQKNINVITFDNGKDALFAMKKLDFDMVITDIQLPEMNGFHFITIYNEMFDTPKIPILAITGRKDVPESYYTQNGFASVLLKPFHLDKFYEKLHHFFPKAFEHNMEKTKKNSTAFYKPQNLENFLGNDNESIKNILQLFLSDSQKNIEQLKSATETNNIRTIKALSHKMLSMFGQIQAEREVGILRQLEKSALTDFENINLKVNELEQLFTEECLPSITDYIKNLS